MTSEEARRLPSFNDFSPGIIGDIRRPLRIVRDSDGDRDAAIDAFAAAFFGGKANKRSSTNVPASLGPGGLRLVDLEAWRLTDLGTQVLDAPDEATALSLLAKELIEHRNADVLIDAIRALDRKGFTGSLKIGLKHELESRGIVDLAPATTDHTTLFKWLVRAGILASKGRGRGGYVDDEALKRLIGVSADEQAEIRGLSAAQRWVLRHLRHAAEWTPGEPVAVSPIVKELLREFPGLFREDQFRADVLRPLEAAGWLDATKLSSGRGAKSGAVTASRKLMGIPIQFFQADFEDAVPSDLREKLQSSLADIQRLIESESKFDRGLGFELLALRMLYDVTLEPRAFRKRSRDTAYAEVDLIAEACTLLFSRWTVQCKCTKTRVGLSDVAKEVGIAVHQKAHVVCVITQASFTTEAERFAEQVARDTALQFVLIPGSVIDDYLSRGRQALAEFLMTNAQGTMRLKRPQLEGPAVHE